eukprot:3426881-Rhodomonas_salina.4
MCAPGPDESCAASNPFAVPEDGGRGDAGEPLSFCLHTLCATSVADSDSERRRWQRHSRSVRACRI